MMGQNGPIDVIITPLPDGFPPKTAPAVPEDAFRREVWQRIATFEATPPFWARWMDALLRPLMAAAGIMAALAVGVAAGSAHASLRLRTADPLGWIQQEFQLDEAVFARVKTLHKSYEPECAEMCLQIARANGRVQTLTEQNNSMTPALEEALREAHASHAKCQTALLTHIYETAALMPPAAAERYLKVVTARVTCRDGQCIAAIMEDNP